MKKLTIQKTFCTYCRGIIPNKRKQELRIQAHHACKSAVENIEKENGLKQIKDWLLQLINPIKILSELRIVKNELEIEILNAVHSVIWLHYLLKRQSNYKLRSLHHHL